MYPFCGLGFITTDGPEWKQFHDLLDPGFNRSNVSDLAPLEEHLRLMLEQIPVDGFKIDLQPWIFKLVSYLPILRLARIDSQVKYLDMNTLFLFGEPIGMLSKSPPPHAEGFLEAFQTGFNGCGMQIALGHLKALTPKGSWLKACKKVHAFAKVYVDQAFKYREEQSLVQDTQPSTKQRTLLYHMAQQICSRVVLRNQIVQAMMASTETTASLISNVIRILASHPLVFSRLRAEILALGNEPLAFDRLGQIKYLPNVITETLRLFPVFPQNNRVALKDTILPTGGGPDGTAPVFAPAGTLFDTSFATFHRNKNIWGPDADEFRPSRWDGEISLSPYEFMPFGAGFRQCLAQQKVTMETSYIIARLLQKFKEIKSEDDRPYQAQVALTAKNAHGCFVSLTLDA